MNNDDLYVFSTRIIWLELNVPMYLVHQKFRGYFGDTNQNLSKQPAKALLSDIVSKIQFKMLRRFKDNDTRIVLVNLFKILDEVQHFYIRQRKSREKLIELNVSNEPITETFEKNRNIARNIIDSVNIWIENCTLHENLCDSYEQNNKFELDYDLLLDIYIYGLTSQALSLLSLSKIKSIGEYTGVAITPQSDIPAEILREHPIVYFNTLLTGNQNILTPVAINSEADSTKFGIAFKRTFNIEFLYFIAVITYFQKFILHDGKYGLTEIDKQQFISEISYSTKPAIEPQSIIDSFTLTKDIVSSQLRKEDPIIWVMGTNKKRFELCPFILLDNDRVFISYCALEQAKQLWVSFFSNGGMCYTNTEDDLTVAISERNTELSNELIHILREKLRSHYRPSFDEVDVDYSRIYEQREINYGDYDIVFYSAESKELFLIEAKFMSDSLTNSGLISDYDKMFGSGKYYSHCRRRYDLVLAEPELLKSFVGATGEIYVHLLFVSSKPLEIEFQDEDGVVNFLCLSIFDKYLEGKLINDDDDGVMRPTHKI
ncbi:MAG: hypothetical protein PHR65_03385 [Syntrophomonadaceae bacterium]|nr:hypothetical protein [Syntrophomonadaceae bacterium]